MKFQFPEAEVISKILTVRGQKIIQASDLALLYGVTAKRLNEQVKRNKERFPDDFAFQISTEELRNLRSQFATSSWGGSRYLPYAFTEHGALMAATVLNSPKAVEMSVTIIRTFVRMRKMLSGNRDFAEKLIKLESRMDKTDKNVEVIFTTIRRLMAPPAPQKKKIGFTSKLKSL